MIHSLDLTSPEPGLGCLGLIDLTFSLSPTWTETLKAEMSMWNGTVVVMTLDWEASRYLSDSYSSLRPIHILFLTSLMCQPNRSRSSGEKTNSSHLWWGSNTSITENFLKIFAYSSLPWSKLSKHWKQCSSKLDFLNHLQKNLLGHILNCCI